MTNEVKLYHTNPNARKGLECVGPSLMVSLFPAEMYFNTKQWLGPVLQMINMGKKTRPKLFMSNSIKQNNFGRNFPTPICPL